MATTTRNGRSGAIDLPPRPPFTVSQRIVHPCLFAFFVIAPVSIGRLSPMQTGHAPRQTLLQFSLPLLLHSQLNGLLQRIAVRPILAQLSDEVPTLVHPVEVGLLSILRALRELVSALPMDYYSLSRPPPTRKLTSRIIGSSSARCASCSSPSVR